MGVSRTRTIKNKHAANKSGISSSKASKAPQSDGVVNSKKKPTPGKGGPGKLADILKKRKRKVYTEKELGIPKLNTVTPIGVTKPKGKKKGKVFVDDREGMNTILAMVQADKEGEIESKMMKARQMEEIREARRVEAEKKEQERKEKLEDTKESLRRKRKRAKVAGGSAGDGDEVVKDAITSSTKASKSRKKRVSFA